MYLIFLKIFKQLFKVLIVPIKHHNVVLVQDSFCRSYSLNIGNIPFYSQFIILSGDLYCGEDYDIILSFESNFFQGPTVEGIRYFCFYYPEIPVNLK